jgi:uncharacterized membrane protein YeaQ/YmgE (transglycosylase-associated protein family)
MKPGYGLVIWVIIGALAGSLASRMAGGDGRATGPGNVVFGVLGALTGGFITRLAFAGDRSTNALLATLLVALVGAVIVIGLYNAIMRPRVT